MVIKNHSPTITWAEACQQYCYLITPARFFLSSFPLSCVPPCVSSIPKTCTHPSHLFILTDIPSLFQYAPCKHDATTWRSGDSLFSATTEQKLRSSGICGEKVILLPNVSTASTDIGITIWDTLVIYDSL